MREELEILMNRRWVLKSEEKELYYRLRDAAGEIRKFATEKMGCQIIANSLLIKMEKIPAVPEEWMGIREFTSREEYALLCVLLMFLEDKDAEYQFTISMLADYISANMPVEKVDWTLYTHRRRLVKVMRYAKTQGIIQVTDGNDESFMEDQSGQVLYENTGASRYFMKNFSMDIMSYSEPEDFLESEWFGVDEERGIARRHRVYKRPLFSPGMYRSEGIPEDFEYLKYYGRRLAEDLNENLDCDLHIHRGSAYALPQEGSRLGMLFPGNNAVSDMILLVCREVRRKVEEGSWKVETDETIHVDRLEFERLLKDVKRAYGSGFTKQYREIQEGEYVETMMEELRIWSFIRVIEKEHMVFIYPAAGKIQGRYPADYTGGNKDEQ